MKHIFLFLALTILNACSPSPQVTVTSEVTVTLTPPPTLTPTPIVVDGIAEDVKGNKLAYLNGEWIILPELEGDFRLMADKDGIRAVDSDGKVVYEYDMATGEWLEAISEAMQAAEQHFADLGYPTDGVELVEGEVTVTGRVDGVKVFEMNIKSGEVMFDQDYVEKQASQLKLDPSDLGPREDVLKATGQYFIDQSNWTPIFEEYVEPLKEQFEAEYGIKLSKESGNGYSWIMLDEEINAWGTILKLDYYSSTSPRYLYYRDETGRGYIVPLMPEK
jgi:hypothetical protein